MDSKGRTKNTKYAGYITCIYFKRQISETKLLTFIG